MKTLIAFDIDGTILSGLPSFFSLSRYFFQKNKDTVFESKPTPPIARKIDKFDDYGIFPTIFFRKPKKNIKKILDKISKKPEFDLAIISGRGRKLLQDITIKELSKYDILKYFNNQIFLKPLTFKSSATWKFHCLKDFCQKYDKVLFVDNDLISSLKIGNLSRENKLSIKIFLLQSLETTPFILNLLKINPEIFAKNNLTLIPNLKNIHKQI